MAKKQEMRVMSHHESLWFGCMDKLRRHLRQRPTGGGHALTPSSGRGSTGHASVRTTEGCLFKLRRLRIRDANHNWRIMYRIDSDAVLILEVYANKTPKIPKAVIGRCKRRMTEYDTASKVAAKKKTDAEESNNG
ncbi:MAG: hypothetical protein R3C05_23305 [Pirellulaceae bacterium]